MSSRRVSALPVIGLTVEVLEAPHYHGRRRYQLFSDYLPCLREAGAAPLLLPGDAGAAELQSWLDLLDGVLFTGGDDLDLRPFGGPPPPPEAKLVPAAQQRFNLELWARAAERRLPALGICLGMQIMGLAHRAPYIQHLDNSAAHTQGALHSVRVAPGSRLAALIGRDDFPVASFHHQGLAGPGEGLTPSAWAADGLIEAVERPDLPFAVGVQWHPERSPEAPHSRALFCGFVAAARAYRKGVS